MQTERKDDMKTENKDFETPIFEIIEFNTNDIITTSGKKPAIELPIDFL